MIHFSKKSLLKKLSHSRKKNKKFISKPSYLFFIIFFLLFNNCLTNQQKSTNTTELDQEPELNYQKIIINPEGGQIELEPNVTLNTPNGIVDSPVEIHWRLLSRNEVNKALYTQYAISKHWAGREIDGTYFKGNSPFFYISGIELKAENNNFNKPLRVTFTCNLYNKPTQPVQVILNNEGKIEKYLSSPIEARYKEQIVIPGIEETLNVYEITMTLNNFSKHAIIDLAGNSTNEHSDCKTPETKCRCGDVRYEIASHDYSNNKCSLKQIVTRLTYVDCPGQPVEEFTEIVPNGECEDIEPIPDLLNYCYGAKWELSLDRNQHTTFKNIDSHGDHNVNIKIHSVFEILPDLNHDGEQSLKGEATTILNWEIEPFEYEDRICRGADAGPLKIPTTFEGKMIYSSFSQPPSISIVIKLESFEAERIADFGSVKCHHVGFDWVDVEVGINYVRYYGIGVIPFIPFSGTHTYPSNSQTIENPQLIIMMPSYHPYTSTEKISLKRCN